MPQKKSNKAKGNKKVLRKAKKVAVVKKTTKPKEVKKNVKRVVKKMVKKVVKKVVKAPVKKAKPKVQKTAVAGSAISGPMGVKPYQAAAKEIYMNEKQLQHFKKILFNWKSQLMEEVDRTMHHMQDDAANYPDPVDRASLEEEFSLELRTRDRERKLLKKIEEALLRIEEGDYGFCDDCGAEIGIRRLEARPTATQCIECKTIAEIREKQIGEGG